MSRLSVSLVVENLYAEYVNSFSCNLVDRLALDQGKNDLGDHWSGISSIRQHILATAMNPREMFDSRSCGFL